MKFTWKGKWEEGEIIIEADSLEELQNTLQKLKSAKQGEIQKIPDIPAKLGCADAIRSALETEWGNKPRSMTEIQEALEANALFFSKGTISGTLTALTKRGDLQRLKETGRWVYSIKKVSV